MKGSSLGHPGNVETFPRTVAHAVRRLEGRARGSVLLPRDFYVHAPKVFFMRPGQMPVRPEPGLESEFGSAPSVDPPDGRGHRFDPDHVHQ
jgi:hypothetical protein